eukprot:104303-Pleurochrysis_carterae.AAC.1
MQLGRLVAERRLLTSCCTPRDWAKTRLVARSLGARRARLRSESEGVRARCSHACGSQRRLRIAAARVARRRVSLLLSLSVAARACVSQVLVVRE